MAPQCSAGSLTSQAHRKRSDGLRRLRTMTNRDFETPRAYRQSLSDRLRQEAKGGVWTLQQLQRHAAYDALLRRLYRRNYGWVIKGAVALIARGLSQRGSLDIDLYRAPSETPSEDAFRPAAADPADDWFHFEVAASQNSVEGTPVIRLPFAAFIGGNTLGSVSCGPCWARRGDDRCTGTGTAADSVGHARQGPGRISRISTCRPRC